MSKQVLSDIFKNTKFWMYLPFAVFYGYKFACWVLDGETYYERTCRNIFSMFSLFLTILYIIVGLKLVGFTL